jgi:asparagine synthase (glutamine-hydrolysing)
MLEGFPWAQNTAYRASFLHPQHASLIDADSFVMDRYRQTVSETDVLPGTSPQEKRMKEMVNLNHRWFMQTLLDRKDRMSMYNGLEVRVPFCDYRIAEYLYRVPWRYKDYDNREKGLLRYAMKGLLPDRVLWRKKSPYPKTLDPKYLEIVTSRLMDVVADPNAPILQLVDKSAIYRLLSEDQVWPWYGQLMRKPQTIAYMLMLNYWLETYRITIVA